MAQTEANVEWGGPRQKRSRPPPASASDNQDAPVIGKSNMWDIAISEYAIEEEEEEYELNPSSTPFLHLIHEYFFRDELITCFPCVQGGSLTAS